MDEYNKDGSVEAFKEVDFKKTEGETLEVLQESSADKSCENISEEAPCENAQELLLKKGAFNTLERLFKAWWIPLVLVCASFGVMIAAVILFAIGSAFGSSASSIAGVALMILSMIVLAVSSVISWISSLVLLYQYWKLLPAEEAVTTPAKAVGYLFIPIFNLYWIFTAYGKLGASIDKLLNKNRSICKNICYAYAIFFALSSFLGYVSQFCIFLFPKWGDILGRTGFFTLPLLGTYIAAYIMLQKAFREYLKDAPANWKNNPGFSKAPLVAGIIAGIIIYFLMLAVPLGVRICYEIKEFQQKKVPVQQEKCVSAPSPHHNSHHKK